MTSSRSSTLSLLSLGSLEFDRMASELFCDTSGSIAAAVDRIAKWQERESVTAEIEISAVLVNIFQREPEVFESQPENESLSQDSLRAMLSMAIQRLVIIVANQCPRHAELMTTELAKATGLPHLLIDIHNGWLRGTLPELSVVQIASAQALQWLKMNYWDKQKKALKEAIDLTKQKFEHQEEFLKDIGATLKAKLEEHCSCMAKILAPSARVYSMQHRNDPGMSLNLEEWNKARWDVFKAIRDVSLSSPELLIFTLVDDGFLTKVDPLFSEGSVKLSSAKDSAWKFLIMELSIYMPQLPTMLVKSVLKRIESKSNDKESWAGVQTAMTPPSDTGMMKKQKRGLKRLTLWFHWLLGKKYPRGEVARRKGASRRLAMSQKDLHQLKLLKVSVAKSVLVDLGTKGFDELLQVCLKTSVFGTPLLEFEPAIGVKFYGGNLRKFRSDKSAGVGLG